MAQITDVIVLGGLSKKSNQRWVRDLTTTLESAFPNAIYHTIKINWYYNYN